MNLFRIVLCLSIENLRKRENFEQQQTIIAECNNSIKSKKKKSIKKYTIKIKACTCTAAEGGAGDRGSGGIGGIWSSFG